MIGKSFSTTNHGTLNIRRELARGGEGRVFETDNSQLLLKIYDPELDPGTDTNVVTQLIQQKTIAYKTFVNLQFTKQRELQCLPLDYVQLSARHPAYVMMRAQGKLLTDALLVDIPSKPIRERLLIAKALALAVGQLHARQVIHADIKPENFFFNDNNGSYLISVLDVDGGGYHAAEGANKFQRFKPTAVPYQPYRSPELVWNKWDTLWGRSDLLQQPDLWSLAVLIYAILVDNEGPFPTRDKHPFVRIPPYDPYGRRDFAGNDRWPKEWQYQLMKEREIPVQTVRDFESLFHGDKCVTKGAKPRMLADDWRRRLDDAVKQLDGLATSRQVQAVSIKPAHSSMPSIPVQPISVPSTSISASPKSAPKPKIEVKTISIPASTPTTQPSPTPVRSSTPPIQKPVSAPRKSRKQPNVLVIVSSGVVMGITPLILNAIMASQSNSVFSVTSATLTQYAIIGAVSGFICWFLSMLRMIKAISVGLLIFAGTTIGGIKPLEMCILISFIGALLIWLWELNTNK